MKIGAAVMIAGALAAGWAWSAAAAQERERGRRGQPQITLYELPNFEGRSVSFFADAPNLSDQRFNDLAQSARIRGSWRLCEDRDYRSRCEPFADDVPDLGRFNFGGRISSVQQVGVRADQVGGPDWRPEMGWGGQGVGRDGVQGRSVVFFRRPSLHGMDVAALGPRSADLFCREAGFGPAVYFDDRERSRRALAPDGQVVENVPALRDVLCRR